MRTNDNGSGGITMAIAIGAFLVATLAAVSVNVHNSSSTKVDAVASQAGLPATIKVALSEFAITPKSLTANAGPLSVEVTNQGTQTHNFSVPALGKKTIDLVPGATAVLDLGTVANGTYPVQCEIPGHASSGMTGTLVVGDGKGSGSTATAMAGMDMSTSSTGKMDNKQMEKDMTAGVTTFLAYAKKYGEGKIKSGNQPLVPTIEADGTKVFHLTAAITNWETAPGKIVKAWTYNGTVPGPAIHVNPGDKVKLVLKNDLPISTDIHMHGVDVPFDQDGVAPITQPYIEPGQTYTYKFTASMQPKLGMYHAHMHGQVAIVNGLFATFEIGDVALPNGRTINGMTIPANLDASKIRVVPMVLNDAGVIGLTLNGKHFPETAPIGMKQGEWIRLDFYNEGLMIHPMHLHHLPQLVIAKDGYPLAEPYRIDTLAVAPGERYSVLVNADDLGTWAMHCHIVSHAENDQGLTDMVTAVVVS